MSIATTLPSSESATKPDISTGDQLRIHDPSNRDQRGTLVLIGCGDAKRDPNDPGDLCTATVGPDESFGPDWMDETGPAWQARDLYISNHFRLKRQFAECVAGCDGGRPGASPWAILSAEHHILMPGEEVKPYETPISSLGHDETDPDHHVRNSFGQRRPDGREIVTEMDQWAALVASGLMKWVASFRDQHAPHGTSTAYRLLVLAGQDYLQPLQERGVFKYGISRMTGDPNRGPRFPVKTRFLFDEIDAAGHGEQMAWLSDPIDRHVEPVAPPEQPTFDGWPP